MRAFLTPRWLGRHALLVVSLVALTLVGLWQFDKAHHQGSWRNYGYAVQWWLFTGFAFFLWLKTVLDQLDPSRVERREQDDDVPAVIQRRVPAPVPAVDDDDDELAAYNRRLAWLNEHADR